MNTLRTLIFVVLGLSLNVAVASPIIIDFSGQPDDVVSELTYEEMGISLTISAWTTSYNSDQDQLEPWTLVDNGFGVSVRDNGIGVKSSANDGSKIDGGNSGDYSTDPDEGLLLQFSEAVNIHDFLLSSLSDDDDVNFSIAYFLSPTQIEISDIFVDAPALSYPEDLFFVPGSAIGTAFMVWVDGASDGVRLKDVSFSKVPEPSTWMLMLFASLMMAVKRRK